MSKNGYIRRGIAHKSMIAKLKIFTCQDDSECRNKGLICLWNQLNLPVNVAQVIATNQREGRDSVVNYSGQIN
jgi:hypothetical protein